MLWQINKDEYITDTYESLLLESSGCVSEIDFALDTLASTGVGVNTDVEKLGVGNNTLLSWSLEVLSFPASRDDFDGTLSLSKSKRLIVPNQVYRGIWFVDWLKPTA